MRSPDPVDVLGELLGTATLRVEGANRLVDDRHGSLIGALVLVADDVLDVPTVDRQCVLGVLLSSPVGELEPEIASAATFVGRTPRGVRIAFS